MKHHIEVTQVFRVERKIIFNVDDLGDNDWNSAVERVASGDQEVPAFDDSNWKSGWDLQNQEEVYVGPVPKPGQPGFQFDACPECGSRSLRCGCD